MCSLHSSIFTVLPLYIIGERHSTSVVTYDAFAAARTSEISIERLCLYVQRVLKGWAWGGTKVNVKKPVKKDMAAGYWELPRNMAHRKPYHISSPCKTLGATMLL